MVLEERGFLLPDHPPQLLTYEMMDSATIRITMGCLDDSNRPSRLQTLDLRDRALPDTAKLDEAGFRAVRDQIRERVSGLQREIVLADRQEAERARPRR
jgi:protein-tyrosine-phosphatase